MPTVIVEKINLKIYILKLLDIYPKTPGYNKIILQVK